jgi:hypothetical protein
MSRMAVLSLGWFLWPAVVFASSSPPAASTGALDFSAVDRLWAIVSVIERDAEPATDDWDALVRRWGTSWLRRSRKSSEERSLWRPQRASRRPSAQRASILWQC